jgi:DinB superfamily
VDGSLRTLPQDFLILHLSVEASGISTRLQLPTSSQITTEGRILASRGGNRMACLAAGMVPRQPGDLHHATFAIDAAAERLCAGLNENQLSWRPQPHCWSIAENLAHLRMTTEAFLPPVDSAIAAVQKLRLQSDGTSSLSFYGRLFVWSMGSPTLIKMRAPEALRPQLHPTPSAELELFLVSQAAVRQRIADTQGLDLTSFRFSSPVASYIRVNLLEFFLACNAHARRHLRQADKLRQAIFSN